MVYESTLNYYDDRSSWSNSMINALVENEIEFNKWYVDGVKTPINQKYSEGQFLHSCLLKKALEHPKCDSDIFTSSALDKNEYLICPDDLDKRAKSGKMLWESLLDGRNIDDLYILKESSAKSIQSMVDSFWESFYPVLDNCKWFEPELDGYSFYDGIPIKGKVDLLICDNDGSTILIDWKGTNSISDFRHKCYTYNYDMQAFIYSYLFETQRFKFYAFDITNYNRWREFEVGEDSLFLNYGETKLTKKMEFVKAYLLDGVNAEIFKKERL